MQFEYELDDQQDYELPATIAYMEAAEDTFFSSVTTDVNANIVGFKLSPSYVLYMTARYLINPRYKPDLSVEQREQLAGMKLKKVAGLIWNTIKVLQLMYLPIFTMLNNDNHLSLPKI